MKKKIIYIGNFSFPNGNASGARVLGNGYIFRELGYETIFIGLEKDLTSNSVLNDTYKTFDKFEYYNLPYPKGISGWLAYRKRFNEIYRLIEKLNIKAIVLYGSPTLSIFGSLVKSFCKQKKIIFLTDVVDWIAIGSGGLLFRIVKFIDTNYQKRYLNSSADGVITISSYLNKYYQKKGLKTVIIPPLVNISHYLLLNQYKSNNAITLIYVGQPFPLNSKNVKEKSFKDRLDKVIDVLYELKEIDFIFDIYGLTLEQYTSVVKFQNNKIDGLKNKMKFHGYIKNEIAREKIAEADFTIFFRDVNKMTTAGFPTKIVESISCGTPVITNNTSDLKEFIVEAASGFIVNIKNDDSLKKDIKKILCLKRDDITIMKNYCRDSKVFSYSNYTNTVRQFLDLL